MLTAGAGFGLLRFATCWFWSWSTGLPPGGSQTVTTMSTVSITSIVVVSVISCLFSKGMAEDKAKRALKATVVDSFMATGVKALGVDEF